MILRSTLLIGLAAGIVSARAGRHPSDVQTELCKGDVKIVIGDGPAPDISWSPNCRMMMLGVEADSSGGDLWWVIATDTSSKGGFVSPVHYGTLPEGASQREAPERIRPLVAISAVGYRWSGAERPLIAGLARRAKQ